MTPGDSSEAGARRWSAAAVAIALILAVAVAGVAWLLFFSPWHPGARPGDLAASASRPGSAPALRFVDGRWQPDVVGDRRGPLDKVRPAGLVRVTGQVTEAYGDGGLARVEVVFAGPAGEATATTDGDGRYQLDVAAGFYRAYVRADGVISVGAPRNQRLPGPPSPREAGSPDDDLAPQVGVFHDQAGVDLEVMRSGFVEGRVFDRAGRPVAGALVRVRADLRPVLGTDLAETDLDGSFRLEVPVGYWKIEASHPAFAGIVPGPPGPNDGHVEVLASAPTRIDLTLAAGCIVRGRVVATDGSPAGEGAIERRYRRDFGPAGRVDPDGSFRWATVEDGAVQLRAWPWKSPPSAARTFACHEGARFDDVVFELPPETPTLAGTITTADGRPAASAYLDIYALAPGGMNQQERADADGRWAVYQLPPGEYAVTAHVDGGGVLEQVVTVPADDVALVLGGTGSIAGAVRGIDHGSIAIELEGCRARRGGEFAMPPTRRVAAVVAGQYRIDDVPACATTVLIRSGRRNRSCDVDVVAGEVTTCDVDLAPRATKVVFGTVHGPDGRAVVGGIGFVIPADDPIDPGRRFAIGPDGEFQVEAGAGDLIEVVGAIGDARATGSARVASDEPIDVRLAPVAERDDDGGDRDVRTGESPP